MSADQRLTRHLLLRQTVPSIGRPGIFVPRRGCHQYLGMLGDLRPHFPEVGEVFDSCDEAASRYTGDERSLSRFAELPENLTDEQRETLDRELRQLGNAMFSVLMADWAVHLVVRRLGIHPDAVGGHSAGELAALWAAGCLNAEMELDELSATMTSLEAQEEADGAPQAALLAVGAPHDTAADVLAKISKLANIDPAELDVFVAMDNCPHQTVLVGTSEAAALAEAELIARNVVYERLSLRRPYHTRLFKPFQGQLSKMFRDVSFELPNTTVYSCSTGRPFPHDAEEIRRQALTQWTTPVQFRRMIENMHDSGVRLFLEVGPRGNLSAFVQDILRGRDHLAVPANISRRGGLVQLMHMAGQLAAHNVPLRLEHFYTRREPTRVPWNVSRSTNDQRQQFLPADREQAKFEPSNRVSQSIIEDLRETTRRTPREEAVLQAVAVEQVARMERLENATEDPLAPVSSADRSQAAAAMDQQVAGVARDRATTARRPRCGIRKPTSFGDGGTLSRHRATRQRPDGSNGAVSETSCETASSQR